MSRQDLADALDAGFRDLPKRLGEAAAATVAREADRALEDWVESGFAEKSGDDHFYGAWSGGKASSGGHPAGGGVAEKKGGYGGIPEAWKGIEGSDHLVKGAHVGLVSAGGLAQGTVERFSPEGHLVMMRDDGELRQYRADRIRRVNKVQPKYVSVAGGVKVVEALEAGFIEKGDDHFYGAWSGGKASAGGHPAGGPSGGVGTLVKQAKEGGFTIPAYGGKPPVDGFQVSPYSDRETVIAAADLKTAHIRDFIEKNGDLLHRPEHYVGGWRDGDKVYLDVSVNCRTVEQATRLGRAANQIAAWDVAKGEEIRFREGASPRSARPPTALLKGSDEADIAAFVAKLKGAA